MDDALKQNYPTHESALERIRELEAELSEMAQALSDADEIIEKWTEE